MRWWEWRAIVDVGGKRCDDECEANNEDGSGEECNDDTDGCQWEAQEGAESSGGLSKDGVQHKSNEKMQLWNVFSQQARKTWTQTLEYAIKLF